MTENIGSGTAQGVIDYLDSLVAKGRSTKGVVTPLKIALTKVLEKTEGESWQTTDIAVVDVQDAISRFKNLTLGTYTDASYRAYELRVQRAINWYKKFLDSPGWVPQQSARTSSLQKKQKVDENGDSKKADDNQRKIAKNIQVPRNFSQESPQPSGSHIDMIAYPFPLKSGDIARLYIPKTLAKDDVKRLAIFLEALVVGEASDE